MPLPYDALRALRYELIDAYDAEVPASGDRKDFVDVCCASWYIRSGGVDVRWRGGAATVAPGAWMLGDDRIRRSQRFRSGTRLLSVRMQPRWSGSGVLGIGGLPAVLPAGAVPALLPAAERLIAALPPSGRGPAHWRHRPLGFAGAAAVDAALLAFVAAWHGALAAAGARLELPALRDERLARALAVLDAHPGLGPAPYAALTAAAGLSRAQLDRAFAAVLATSPRRYRERRCLIEAEHRLRAGAESIKEIAARLGFVDGSHFAKWFSRQTGRTPRRYRGEAGV